MAEDFGPVGDGATATARTVAVGMNVGRRTTTGIGGWVWINSAVGVGWLKGDAVSTSPAGDD